MVGLRLDVLVCTACMLVGALAQTNPRQSTDACCRENMMRSEGFSFLEKDSQIVPKGWPAEGTPFFGIRLRTCSKFRFYVQLWEPKGDKYKLIWQMIITPSVPGVPTTYNWTSPLPIKDTYKFAMQAIKPPGTDLHPSIPVPYFFNEKYHAVHTIESGTLTVGQEYAFTTIKWPISFTKQANAIRAHNVLQPVSNVLFCTDPKCASGLASDTPPSVRIIAGPPGPPGPPGKQGPAGTGNGNSGANSAGECCTDPKVKSERDKYKTGQDKMGTTINNIHRQVTLLVQGKDGVPSGNCPQDFIGGVGQCYWISGTTAQLANAEMKCRELKAHLVSIKREVEQRFLLQELSKLYRDTPLFYYTSGMWSIPRNSWVWYHEGSARDIMEFKKWAPGEASIKDGYPRQCMALQVSKGTDFNLANGQVTMLWRKITCSLPFYFICQQKKDCN